MLKRATMLLTILILPVVLAGCGLFGGAGTQISAGLQPTQLGFEVNDSGEVTIVSNNVTFTNPANAPSALVTGYSISFFDDAGTEVVVDSNLANVRGLSILIPPGYVCADAETEVCDLNSRTYVPRQSQPEPFIFVPGPIALAILDIVAPMTRAHAEITFFAVRDGVAIDWTVEVDVTYPVAGGE